MVQRALYRQSVPKDTQLQNRGSGSRQVQTAGSVAQGGGVTESVAVNPSGQQLEIGLRGAGAARIIESYAELFDADGIEAVAFYGVDQRTPMDGYYALEGVESEPVIRGSGDGGSVVGRLRRKGTRKSHWRAVATNPYNGYSSSLNQDQTRARITVPSAATQVRWMNADGETEAASPFTSGNGTEQGDIDVYDARTSSFETDSSNATMIYDLPYMETGKVDAKVWDTRGFADKTDSDGVLQWQKVYRPDHVFEGACVLDTTRLRLYLDDDNQTISAEEWGPLAETWNSVSLGASDWVVYDVDITAINQCRVDAQVRFSNTDDNDAIQFYSYDLVAHRGRNDIMFKDPPDEANVNPSNLDTLLSPIADEDSYDPQQVRTLVDRDKTRL